MNFFRTTDTTDTTIWKPGLIKRNLSSKGNACSECSMKKDAHEEEEAISVYFSKGFSYNDILALLDNSNAMVLNIIAFE